MARKYSDHYPSSVARQKVSPTREPPVFVVTSDPDFCQSVFSQCSDVPKSHSTYPDIPALMDYLGRSDRLSLAFAIIVERSGRQVDAPSLRVCKLNYPQLYFLVLLDECEQSSFLRFESIGVQNVLLPPFTGVSLAGEIDTALPNVPQFKRHPDLMKRGLSRLDFLIPSDLSYVVGVNHLISMLLKEFGFPATDCRINIPLACDEAITNAIIHGNNSDRDKKVSIKIYISSSRIKLRVKDQGNGFDVEKVANPLEGENVMRSSGRGIYLMKSIMDKVKFSDGGREVEIEKMNTSTNNSNSASGKH